MVNELDTYVMSGTKSGKIGRLMTRKIHENYLLKNSEVFRKKYNYGNKGFDKAHSSIDLQS